MTDPTHLPADPARDGPAHNQVPPLEDYNLYTSDPVLAGAVRRAGASAHAQELAAQGAAYGAAATWRDAEDANRHEPELHTHNRLGERIDVVRFHPAWDRLMDLARRHGVANRSFFDADAHAWTVRAASHFMHCQVEAGTTCPTTMTHAAIPVLRRNAGLYASLESLLAARSHDARDLPLTHKSAMTLGMGMTERQSGSDVRTNTTRAVPAPGETVAGWGDAFVLSGSKWFFSAPMCDAHLVLAREQASGEGGEVGLSCFFVPRWQPDGRKNPVHIQRLKDKLGNRSNASAEVDFDAAWGVRVGEPGRGIATILEMATHTRLDCALSSAAFMRQGLAQALHHARGRAVFGRPLAQQPLMQAVLADLALESEGATLLGMDLAARFGRAASGQASALDLAWRRLLTPVAKYWNCKRAVAFAGEAMEVLGGNGYVEEAPLARLFREAPVNSIWEGSGNVMCLDLLRAVAREPDDARLLLGHLAEVARQAASPALLALVGRIEGQIAQSPAVLEGQARLLAQRLALAAQCALVLQFGGSASAGAFVQTRLDADWGAAWGGVPVPGAPQILAQAWADID